jgi:hypothetical protein
MLTTDEIRLVAEERLKSTASQTRDVQAGENTMRLLHELHCQIRHTKGGVAPDLRINNNHVKY